MTLQIVRDWVVRSNAQGPGGLIDRKAPGEAGQRFYRPAWVGGMVRRGQASRLNDTHRAALAAVIESGPIAAVHGVVRWRIIDLCQWIWDEFQVTIAEQTPGRELRAMKYRKLSARLRHHALAEGAIEASKKALPPSLAFQRLRRWNL